MCTSRLYISPFLVYLAEHIYKEGTMAKVCDATRFDEKSRRADPFSNIQPERLKPRNERDLPIGLFGIRLTPKPQHGFTCAGEVI